ncbi:MAG: hypothetical protein HGA44_21655, partial [Cellulomonadaceae bacterium]|nr:hypothetical protein [Cellulomonadaceae bacterium]
MTAQALRDALAARVDAACGAAGWPATHDPLVDLTALIRATDRPGTGWLAVAAVLGRLPAPGEVEAL